MQIVFLFVTDYLCLEKKNGDYVNVSLCREGMMNNYIEYLTCYKAFLFSNFCICILCFYLEQLNYYPYYHYMLLPVVSISIA